MAFPPIGGPQGPVPFAPQQPQFPGAGPAPAPGGAPDLGAFLGGPQGPQGFPPQFPGAGPAPTGPAPAPMFGCGANLDTKA